MNAPAKSRLKALVSIHDVMPNNLDDIETLVDLCREAGIHTPWLLVVPGLSWHARSLERLRTLHDAGCPLVAHGWVHHCQQLRGWGHRLHSLLISRRVAEHLALRPAERVALIRRSVAWFAAHDFPTPQLYVPPAWALGRLSREERMTLPVPWVETTRGMLCTRTGRWRLLPLVGYEADTRGRAVGLAIWNRLQETLVHRANRPLRIALHPADHRLRLHREMRDLLQRVWSAYADVDAWQRAG